jgi:ribonucleotide reductase beta subunit family protein with ferritin-like domain
MTTAILTANDDWLLKPGPDTRYTLRPIQYPVLYEWYQKQTAAFWTASEIVLNQDVRDWKSLEGGEQFFLLRVLAFFAGIDGIVQENLANRFQREVFIPELRACYAMQAGIEVIHADTYSMLIEAYVPDLQMRTMLFESIKTIPTITMKAEWTKKWIDSNDSFAERLVAFAAVEGVFFSSSFCSINFFKKQGKLPGLVQSNELISRDEGEHVMLACIVYKMLNNKLSQERVHDIIRSAVDIEMKFVDDSLPVNLIGMNASMMKQYVKFNADRLLMDLGLEKIYHETNPFEWMVSNDMAVKSNFFERQTTAYSKSITNNIEDNVVRFDEDF